MTRPAVDVPWLGAGIFRPLLHRVDLTTAPWHFDDWRDIWFAACLCPVIRLWGDTAAGRQLCPACARLTVPVLAAPIQRGPSDG